MLVFKSIALIVVSGCASSVDPCTTLCDHDGHSICTKGSWTEKGVCRNYFFQGNPSDMVYCYHSSTTASRCPGTGTPVSPGHVQGLIAAHRSSASASAHEASSFVPVVPGPTAQPIENRTRAPPAGGAAVVPTVLPQPVVVNPPQSVRPGAQFQSIVVAPRSQHTATVFLLHGKNGRAEHMIDLGRASWMAHLPTVKFVSITPGGGPWFRSLTDNPAEMAMRIFAGQEVADIPSLDTNMHTLTAMIDVEAALLPGGHSKVFLVGYSQGSMLSLYTALMGGRRLGGVVAMNGAVPVIILGPLSAEGASVPIIHFHGIQDQIVPVEVARLSKRKADGAGCRNYELVERPGSHDPSSGVTMSVTEWLAAKL